MKKRNWIFILIIIFNCVVYSAEKKEIITIPSTVNCYIRDLKNLKLTWQLNEIKNVEKVTISIFDNKEMLVNENFMKFEKNIDISYECYIDVVYNLIEQNEYWIKIDFSNNLQNKSKIIKIVPLKSEISSTSILKSEQFDNFDKITISKYSNYIALAASNKLFFLNKNGNIINKLDIQSSYKCIMKFNPNDENELFYVNKTDNEIYIIDLYQSKIIEKYKVSEHINDIIFDSKGEYFITCESYDSFSFWKRGLLNPKFRKKVNSNYKIIKIHDEGVYYVESPNLIKCDLWGNTTQKIDLNKKGKKINLDTLERIESNGVFNEKRNSFLLTNKEIIYEINFQGEIIRKISLPMIFFSNPYKAIYISKPNKLILYGNYEILIFNEETLEPERIIKCNFSTEDMDISDNGIIAYENNDIFKMSLFD